MSDIFYNVSDEHSYESIEECMDFIFNNASSESDALGWVIEVHKRNKPTHSHFVSASSIIDSMACCAYDEYSEYADDYLEDVLRDSDKLKSLEKLISDWLDKNAESPRFWISGGQVDSIVVDKEMIDKYGITF